MGYRKAIFTQGLITVFTITIPNNTTVFTHKTKQATQYNHKDKLNVTWCTFIYFLFLHCMYFYNRKEVFHNSWNTQKLIFHALVDHFTCKL